MSNSATGILADIINKLSFSNPNFMSVLIPTLIAQLFGFTVYIFAIGIAIKEKKSCYPPFVHTFFIAFDGYGVYYWHGLAAQYDHFWFFVLYSIALSVWVFLEIWSIYGAIKYERQEFWRKYYDNHVTVKQAIIRCSGEVVFFLAMIILYNQYMGGGQDASMMKFYVWSNVLLAFFPGYLWAQRKTRTGASVGLAIAIVLDEMATFAPNGFGMWTALSSYFSTPEFYFAGFVTVMSACYQLSVLLKFPPKPKRADGKWNIW